MTDPTRTALSRLLRAAKDANSWAMRIDGSRPVPERVLKAAANALQARPRATVGYVVVTEHQTHFKERLTAEERELRLGGQPVWRPVVLSGEGEQ